MEDLPGLVITIIYVIGQLLACLGSFSFIPGIFVAVSYIKYKSDETKKAAWKVWAQTNGFTFVPGKWQLFSTRGSLVQGEYQAGYLLLESFGQHQGRSRSTYTRLAVSSKQPPGEGLAPSEFELGRSLAKKEIIQMLTPISGFRSKGEISAQNGGEKLLYEQEGLETDPTYLQTLLELMTQLLANYPKVLALGGEAVSGLKSLAKDHTSPLHGLARQLLVDIGEETARRLKSSLDRQFCPRCLTCCIEHELQLSWLWSSTYYGCRTCGQSRQFLKGPLIALLDSQMESERLYQPEGWYINWLQRRELFDFSRVEIVQASDEDVERLAVQVGNDTDERRRAHYARMRCAVAAQCQLSENTLRILERMFGEVEVQQDGRF